MKSCRPAGCSPRPSSPSGLAAVESAGDWFFAPEWLEEQRAAVRARLAERASSSPLDPGIPLGELLPHEPWAPAVLQLLRVERRDGKAYAPGAAPQLGDQAACGRGARGPARGRGPGANRRPQPRRLPRGPRDAEARRRRVRGLGRPLRARPRGVADALADHPRRLPRCRWASRDAPRSCCSSATTRTVSPSASATSGACARGADWTSPPGRFRVAAPAGEKGDP